MLVLTSTEKWNISIHTLRMEGDTHANNATIHVTISIHTLRMEGDCLP